MNFFNNSNSRVEKHTTGYSSADVVRKGVGLSARETIAKSVVTESAANDLKRYNKIEKDFSASEQTTAIIEASLMEGKKLATGNNAYQEGKELLFKNVLFEAFYSCLYLDDEFKTGTKESLYGVVSDFVDERGGFKLLESAVASSKSPFLKEIKSLCEATARRVCNRKLKEGIKTIDFSLNAEEEEEFNYGKNNLGIEELSELVKSKVLTVVKDEKNRERQESELLQDLANDVDKSLEDVEEAVRQATIGGSVVEESTLFNSLFRDSYAQYVTEGCKRKVNEAGCKSKKGKPVTEEDETTWDENTEEFEIDMDVVLAETITKYTLMEMCNTIMLEGYTHIQLRSMIHTMLNK